MFDIPTTLPLWYILIRLQIVLTRVEAIALLEMNFVKVNKKKIKNPYTELRVFDVLVVPTLVDKKKKKINYFKAINHISR